MNASNAAGHRIRIWDLPTRLFHWALLLTMVGSFVTGQLGGGAMVWHLRLGQVALVLLLFRLAWGLLGGRWSRFSALALRPRSFVLYLRGQGDASLQAGHSPMGSLSVVVFGVLLAAQIGAGLVSNDDIAFAGPLSHWVSNAMVAAATAYHKGPGKLLLVLWVVLHLAALGWYSLRGRKLVPAMVHGDKTLTQAVAPSRDDIAHRIKAAIVLAVCVALGAWVFSLAPTGF